MNSKMPGLTFNDLTLVFQRNAMKANIDNIFTTRINTNQQQTNEQMDNKLTRPTS